MMPFVFVALTVWTLMHLYVGSRLWDLPAWAGPGWHRALLACAAALWLSLPLGLSLSGRAPRAVAAPVEVAGTTWVGLLFLLLVCLLAADIVTGFGWLWPGASRAARAAAVAGAVALAGWGFVQAMRAPETIEHRVAIAGLRPELDGFRVVQLSDLHVGPVLGARWIADRVAQVERLRPDLLVVTGDMVDRDAELSDGLAPALARLHAPLGVWGVTGNHEFYAGLDRSLQVFARAGIRVLRDEAVEVAPGLVLAGVDDLSARRQFGAANDAVGRVLGRRPPGATILLSHSPLDVERAAALGAALMLSGHTHDGQIWPFRYLVRLAFPYLSGRYDLGSMALVVSRGTGFWGPPIRLFRRSEITVVTLTGSVAR